ncbi:MAG TPA: glycerophosphodiester phosphodiesterase [Thermoanaerobaculia bacterium]|nr:glycerophosphodiester phosphodiesterase [Thermoanaerobaculia bacterium]
MIDSFLIYGHRGSPKRFPENTMASFEETLRAGADGFETDLRLLFDHTAVLFHDDLVDDDDTESLTFTQLAERGALVDRLEDLSRFAGRAKMVLEVKKSKWEQALIEHVSRWPDVVVASFDHSAIAELASRGVRFPLGITFHGYLMNVADYVASLGATWCFPNYHYVDEDMVTSLRARNIRVIPWTANRVREWNRLAELGCDGVITDFPADAVEWRTELQSRRVAE